MRFVSTRDGNRDVSFQEAILNCMPEDGGLYVPTDIENLRNWILYANETTSFANLAGTLTSGIINKEFSPLICERIATQAFVFEPKVRQLDDNLFILELYHGPTGTFKDFGTAYLGCTLETILQYTGQKSILLDATTGELGSCMATALRGKKLVKSVLLYPKGTVRGIKDSDLVWNGGNIYPIEVEGTFADCRNLVREIFSKNELVKKYHLTLGNTANIGRLLPQAFFYTYAFTRIKKYISGSIFYALSAGNYGNLISGLYGWQLSLPVNGFILPTTENLTLDPRGDVQILDSMIPLEKRHAADPADPSNLERLEHLFKENALMMRSFVYPAVVSEEAKGNACKELFMKYKIYADSETSAAYAAAKARADILEDEDSAVVLVARNSPELDSQFIRHNLGTEPASTPEIKAAFEKFSIDRPAIKPDDVDQLISVLNSLNLRRIF
ncbi:MAG: threonine synthase [Treponema sp.]|nr:threonine synthase [Treponema sp.]